MKRQLTAALGMLVLGFTTLAVAQSTTQDRPKDMDQVKSDKAQMVSVEGCLVNEKDVRTPNVAERAAGPTGMFKDYILTDVKFLKGEPPAVGTSGKEGASASNMFEVRGIDSDQLKSLVGQRVQIEGTLNPEDFPERSQTQAKEGQKSGNDLPEIKGTSIKAVSGECKAPIK